MIVNYLEEFQIAKKKNIRVLLWDKLPDILDDKQKERKIGNLLASLKKEKLIKTMDNDRTSWILNK